MSELHIIISQDQQKRLDDLIARKEFTSYGEAIRFSLKLLDQYFEKRK